MRLVAALLAITSLGGGARAEVVRAQIASKRGARDVTVILPPGYTPRRRYPVLYMLDGQNLLEHPWFSGGWRAEEGLHRAVHEGKSEPMIVVGVHAGDRVNEYTSVPDADEGGGAADAFVHHLVKDVVPWVGRNYAVRRGKQSRAIGGASLGANAALHAVLTRGDVFGRALVMSPSLWWAEGALYDQVRRSRTIRQQHVVLYNGGDDDGREETEALRDLLHKKGLVFDRSLHHWTEPSGNHDEPSWARFFPRALERLFPAR